MCEHAQIPCVCVCVSNHLFHVCMCVSVCVSVCEHVHIPCLCMYLCENAHIQCVRVCARVCDHTHIPYVCMCVWISMHKFRVCVWACTISVCVCECACLCMCVSMHMFRVCLCVCLCACVCVSRKGHSLALLEVAQFHPRNLLWHHLEIPRLSPCWLCFCCIPMGFCTPIICFSLIMKPCNALPFTPGHIKPCLWLQAERMTVKTQTKEKPLDRSWGCPYCFRTVARAELSTSVANTGRLLTSCNNFFCKWQMSKRLAF